MNVYLVRHGESESNVKNIFAGFSNVPLTVKGQQQAVRVGNTLSSIKWDGVVSSPLDRALHTAQIIVGESTEIATDARLKEMNFGVWEGLSFEEILVQYPEISTQWMADYTHFICPKGESLEGFYKRVKDAYKGLLEEFLKGDQTANYLVVAHAGVIQSILASELHDHVDGYWRYKLTNCGYAVLEYDGEFSILKTLSNEASEGAV